MYSGNTTFSSLPSSFLDFILMSPKHLHTLSRILAISALSSCLPVIAHGKNGWQYDSLGSQSDSTTPDAQRIYDLLLGMLDSWNAHDLEKHLESYWKSPELLVVIDAEQINGWQQLHDSYLAGYPDRNAMGSIEPGRVQVRLLKPDFALALTWWTINFPTSNRKVVGNTTMNLQKFDGVWKIVASHSSTAEM
jgi:uncharacterized protein (TIGR02246 family)